MTSSTESTTSFSADPGPRTLALPDANRLSTGTNEIIPIPGQRQDSCAASSQTRLVFLKSSMEEHHRSFQSIIHLLSMSLLIAPSQNVRHLLRKPTDLAHDAAFHTPWSSRCDMCVQVISLRIGFPVADVVPWCGPARYSLIDEDHLRMTKVQGGCVRKENVFVVPVTIATRAGTLSQRRMQAHVTRALFSMFPDSFHEHY